MTHSGGKPHAVGDEGQRFEVSYLDPQDNERKTFGWTDGAASAQRMASCIEKHPEWRLPQILDRAAEQLAGLVLNMGMVTDKGLVARQLARKVLRVEDYGKAVKTVWRPGRDLPHDGECCGLPDDAAKSVCEAMYEEKLDYILELIESLKAIRTLCGEDKQIVKIVDEALSDPALICLTE